MKISKISYWEFLKFNIFEKNKDSKIIKKLYNVQIRYDF